MEKNQREIKGADGVTRVYTFGPVKRRDAMKAQFLLSGFVKIFGVSDKVDMMSMDFSAENFDKYLWPTAEILLRDCTIYNESEIIEIEELKDTEYFEGRIGDLINAVMVAGEVAGFLPPVDSSTKATGKTTLKE